MPQAEENKSTTERVFTDRSSHLQLAIVRCVLAVHVTSLSFDEGDVPNVS